MKNTIIRKTNTIVHKKKQKKATRTQTQKTKNNKTLHYEYHTCILYFIPGMSQSRNNTKKNIQRRKNTKRHARPFCKPFTGGNQFTAETATRTTKTTRCTRYTRDEHELSWRRKYYRYYLLLLPLLLPQPRHAAPLRDMELIH